EPEHRLPHHRQGPAPGLEEFAGPRSRGNDEPSSLKCAAVGNDTYARGARGPFTHCGSVLNRGGVRRQARVRRDTLLDKKKTGLRFQDALIFVAELQRWKSSTNLTARKHFDRQVMLARGSAYPLHDAAAGAPHVQAVALSQQLPAVELLEVVPALEGPAHQRYVARVLVVGGADDPRLAVRTATVVANAELFQPQHADAAAGELETGRRAHAADANDDHIV